MPVRIPWAMLAVACMAMSCTAVATEVVIEVEEDVYTFVNPDNGASPIWSRGSVIARIGDSVYVSKMDTAADMPPTCNTRWVLLHRTEAGWRTVAEADAYRQREPCPIAVMPGKDLFISVNDSLDPECLSYCTCNPHLIQFSFHDQGTRQTILHPKWPAEALFKDHSYRGLAADPDARQLLLLNIDAKTNIQHACLLSDSGDTLARGSISFPIRGCYPHVALHDGAVQVLAVGDIVEPIEEWRAFKYEKTGRDWDYVFRVLYHTSTPDLRLHDFATPIEVANVEATGGFVLNQDMWVAPDGSAYILYIEREVDSALMRDQFFPGGSLTNALKLAVVKDGAVIMRRELAISGEEGHTGTARLHQTPDGSVYAVMFMHGPDGSNMLLKLYPDTESVPVAIPFKKPLGLYHLASVATGNKPSDIIDLFGHSSPETMSYARIVIKRDGFR
jgi:hypothetical protein